MKQDQTPNPPVLKKDKKDKKSQSSNTWQKIGKFFADYWYIFLAIAVVIAVAAVIISTNSKKRKPLF